MTPPDTTDPSIEQKIEQARGTNGEPSPSEAFEDADAEAAFWRAQFEAERERLAKLWVAYQDVEAELELRKAEAEQIAQRKAAATLAGAEAVGTDAGEKPEQPGVLAIAPPDAFEVVCEAQQREVPAGRGTSFGLVFANRGEEPVTAGLTVEDVPEGWSALPTEETIELDGHSSKTVYVLVRSPEDATPGRTERVTVAVQTPEGPAQTLDLVADIVEREDPSPEADQPEEIVDELEDEIGEDPEKEEADEEDEPTPTIGEEPTGDAVEDEAPEGIEEDEAAEHDEGEDAPAESVDEEEPYDGEVGRGEGEGDDDAA